MVQQTPSEHLCDGCTRKRDGICNTGPERFPECWEANEVVNPIEAKWDTHFSPFMKKGENK